LSSIDSYFKGLNPFGKKKGFKADLLDGVLVLCVVGGVGPIVKHQICGQCLNILQM